MNISADGRLAYGYSSDVGVLEADGSAQTKLADGIIVPEAPQWSPDGQRMVFTGFGNPTHLVTVDTTTGATKDVMADHGSSQETDPDWSPDGREIVFNSTDRFSGRSVQIVNVDGSGRHVVIPHGAHPDWQPCVAGRTVNCNATPPIP